MITAIALDDEPPSLKIIENFCSRIDFVDLQKVFTKPNEALKHLRKFPTDLIFLDIQMPALTGIEFYKSIQQQTLAIFTTAYSDYAVEGFNVNAVDYLLKPFTFERFQAAVNKANDQYSILRQKKSTQSPSLYIRADYSLIKINVADILYIEGLDDYIKIHLPDKKPVVARLTMKAMIDKLNPEEFIRVHRSYIIPLSKVDSIRNKTISIGGKEIPIGSSYEENFNNHFKS
jgi:DNA-binding LytR/AlgR family response regulator